MKRLILALVAIGTMLTSCATNEVKTTIEGRFVGNRVDSVFLEQVSDKYDAVNRLGGEALTSDSNFKFEFKLPKDSSPRFFRLTFDSTIRPITLVVKPGDNIYLDSAGDIFLNYEVQNSEESKLIEEFNKEYFASVDRLAHLSERIANNEKGVSALNMQAYAAAKGAMQAQVRFVGSQQNTLAAFYAARQHVVEEYVLVHIIVAERHIRIVDKFYRKLRKFGIGRKEPWIVNDITQVSIFREIYILFPYQLPSHPLSGTPSIDRFTFYIFIQPSQSRIYRLQHRMEAVIHNHPVIGYLLAPLPVSSPFPTGKFLYVIWHNSFLVQFLGNFEIGISVVDSFVVGKIIGTLLANETIMVIAFYFTNTFICLVPSFLEAFLHLGGKEFVMPECLGIVKSRRSIAHERAIGYPCPHIIGVGFAVVIGLLILLGGT